MNNPCAIIPDDRGNYYVIEDPDWVAENEKDAIAVLDADEATGEHQFCMEGYGGDCRIDGLQDEESLPDGTYAVMYYRILEGQSRDGGDYLSLADYGITKEQLIENAAAGKYIDGATYWKI